MELNTPKRTRQAFYSLMAAGALLLLFVFFASRVLSSPSRAQAQEQTSKALDEATSTATPTQTVTPSPTSTVTPTPTATSAPQGGIAFLPIISRFLPSPTPEFVEPETMLYCADLNSGIAIPDSQAEGIQHTVTINDWRAVQDINVQVNVRHSWVGDITVALTHAETNTSVLLLDRPGFPGSTLGCGQNDIYSIFDDEMSLKAENQCYSGHTRLDGSLPPAVGGMYRPEQPLSAFDMQPVQGNWTITVADHSTFDTGRLAGWCIEVQLGVSSPPPPPVPPPALPDSARVRNVGGQPQAMPLDCESRVAVDWAAFFGVPINEFDFFNKLPRSDNPDVGFVGSVWGTWGQIPPNPYGIHAEPVAALLREYGVPAYVHRPLSWDDLRAEIAAGRPVYVWTIGAASRDEAPIYYYAADGRRSVVSHFEHTIMVVGYTPDSVIINDGGMESVRSKRQFLSSWSALGNMAITAQP